MSKPEIDPTLATWAFKGHLPYGTYPEEVVDGMNSTAEEHMGEPVALSHFYTMGEEGKLLRFAFPKEDVIEGEFRGFELIEGKLHFPVGIRMDVNLVPGSSPGINREEVVRLWDEGAEALRIPNFDYQRVNGSIWRKIMQGEIKIRL